MYSPLLQACLVKKSLLFLPPWTFCLATNDLPGHENPVKGFFWGVDRELMTRSGI